MSQASNVIAMPVAQSKRYMPENHRAEIIDISDFFVDPPVETLLDAKIRIMRELPPKPDLTGLSDWERADVIYSWVRVKLHVYQTVIFG